MSVIYHVQQARKLSEKVGMSYNSQLTAEKFPSSS